ncbi:hypothetical protein [Petrachloros mirabilis]
MPGDATDEFQQELVELFVQEAQEWLENIHVSLDELQQEPPLDRHEILIKNLIVGVTNLGGSAATINLPEVEQASFAVLPLIEAIKDPQKPSSPQTFLSLCRQLGQIHTALTNATGVSFVENANNALSDSAPVGLAPGEFLQFLRGLELKLDKPGQVSVRGERNLIKTMIRQMEEQLQEGVRVVRIEAVREYLERTEEAEGDFVKLMDVQAHNLSTQLLSLADSPSPPAGLTETALQDVKELKAEAQQVNSIPATTFFGGLHSLLSVVTRHKLRLEKKKAEAIVSRLNVIRELTHQWMDLGRAERAAIRQILQESA